MDRSLRLDARIFWIFQGLFWLASTLSLKAMVTTFLPVGEVSPIIFGRILTGVLMTTFLYLVYQSRWLQRAKRWVKWSFILSLNIGLCLAGAAFWVEMIRRGTLELPAESPFLSIALARFYSLSLWNAAYLGITFFINYKALKLEATEASLAVRSSELQQLQSQLNPHFLFNALTLLQNRIGPESPGQEVIQMLSEHLRFSLEKSKPLEPLGRELDALESYLELQRARFADNLECYIETSPAALKVLVPPMLVQPLLENAFKFGPRSSPMPMRVGVNAMVENGVLLIVVTNSGKWVTAGHGETSGTGLNNLRRRLFLLLGEPAKLEVIEKPEEVRVEIKVPLVADPQSGLREHF